MKVTDNGCFYTVHVPAGYVRDFQDSWPCSGLRARGVWFCFDKTTGDLVDTNAADAHPHADGSAIRALSEDAQAYGQIRG